MGSLPWHASDAQMAFWPDQVVTDKLEHFKQLSDALLTQKNVVLCQPFVGNSEADTESELSQSEDMTAVQQ